MSKYGEFETVFREEKYLVLALEEMGYSIDFCPGQGDQLVGYHGDRRPERANIIIRRHQLGRLYNDVGFARQPDGTLKAILSDHHVAAQPGWLNRVKQLYAEKRTMALARARGYQFRGRETIQTATGPAVRLLFAAR